MDGKRAMTNPVTKGKGKAFTWLKAHVDFQGDVCLPWPFCRDRKGYGALWHNGRGHWAHRLMCTLMHGDPPTPKHQAAHECGKGHYGCVNPRHLFWKTSSENHLDRRKTGSMLRNVHGPKSLLPPETIAQFIALKGQKTQVEIARMFGVSTGCVEYWQHARSQRYPPGASPAERLEALLANGPMHIDDAATLLYPDCKSAPALLAQRIKQNGFKVRDGFIHPRQAA